MKNLIIHGHFYQPPRENPWTGIIEDQKDAAPYSNWNQRINRESYEPNAFSPLLNSEGRIINFYNNYSYLSYNTGPTLLNWLKEESEHVYNKIIEGDSLSIKRLGHGNAMAQVYNHIILPLADPEDLKTQILWGLENFFSHFGRNAPGMWLSETAINNETASELIRSGIKFTVLSPWQAGRFRFDGGSWEESRDYTPQLWQHPWRMKRPEGDLTIFFYHPHLSAEISFNHLLRDADYFYTRVKSEFDETGSSLLSIATDGEIYGHHEPLGNMGLSAFLNKAETDKEYRVVNFSWAQANIKTAGEIELIDGDRGSSWSCSHGVSRWYTDCGCSTGGEEGWNQFWRTPLRDALDDLALSSDRVYKSVMSRLSDASANEIRNKYIKVLSRTISPDSFFNEYCPKKNSQSDKRLFFRLLEGQKFKMYMFTSCGWFFSDISGVEPQQNLMYAARLMDLYAPFYSTHPEGSFLEKLSHAQSNIPEKGNGAVLFTMSKYTKIKEIYKTALSMIIRQFYGISDSPPGILKGTITPRDFSRAMLTNAGTLEITTPLTDEKTVIPFSLERKERLFSSIILFPEGDKEVYTPESISRMDKEDLMKKLCLMELHSNQSISKKYSGIINQLDEWMKLKLPDGEDLKNSIKSLLHYAFREVTFLMESGNSEGWNCFMELQKMNKAWKIPLPEDLTLWLNRILDRELLNPDRIISGLNNDSNEIINQLIILLRSQQDSSHQIINSSLSGRIFDMMTGNEQGQLLIKKADQEIKNKMMELLNLSEEIQFFPR